MYCTPSTHEVLTQFSSKPQIFCSVPSGLFSQILSGWCRYCLLTWSMACTEAPLNIRKLAVTASPRRAARWRGVWPKLFDVLRLPPHSKSCSREPSHPWPLSISYRIKVLGELCYPFLQSALALFYLMDWSASIKILQIYVNDRPQLTTEEVDYLFCSFSTSEV